MATARYTRDRRAGPDARVHRRHRLQPLEGPHARLSLLRPDHSEPAGVSTLIRNGVLAALALFVVIDGWGAPGWSLIGWLGDLSGFEIVLGIVSLVLIAAVSAEGWLLVHLLGQNGRVLLRLDQFEQAARRRRRASSRAGRARGVNVIKPPVGRTCRSASPAPAFKLEGLHGETMTLDSLRSARKPVMLVFSDPGCGPCNALLPDSASGSARPAQN